MIDFLIFLPRVSKGVYIYAVSLDAVFTNTLSDL